MEDISVLKGLLVLLCTTVLLSPVYSVDEDFCKYKPDGVYPDSKDGCAGFLHCHNYHTTYKLCPGGLKFNAKTSRCDWPRNVDCPMGVLHCDVAIVGGGISGVYAAYRLLKTNKKTKVCVFEKDVRLGGRILDHRFKQAPDIVVGLGAWRIDKYHDVVISLLSELGLRHTEWSFVEPSFQESRGVYANNKEDIKKAYPALLKSKFGKMTSGQMLDYACQDVPNKNGYATVDTFVSHRVSPEGAEYLSELYGYKGDYTEFISPASYLEFTEMSLKLSDKYIRPVGGMSAIVDTLVKRVEKLGGHIYTSTRVNSIDREGSKFVLATPQLMVKANKLIVDVPPLQFEKVNGTVARRLQNDPVFKSIQPVPAFKGAAVYSKAWWENVNIAGGSLKAVQKFISYSNCLGTSVAYRGKGPQGAGVLHTMYNDGACSRRWADIARLKKNFLDTEVHRALENKFKTTLPRPLDTVYQYWDSAWHFQKPGTPYTMVQVADWAKRPFKGEDLFVVGEAVHPLRGWSEGALVSTDNALLEGWRIRPVTISRVLRGTSRSGAEFRRMLRKNTGEAIARP